MAKIFKNESTQMSDRGELVTDSGRIARLLDKMSLHYSPLAIEIPGYKMQYTSCIVGVDKPYVMLDQLMPPSGHDKLMAERKMQVTGKLDGVNIKFSTTVVRAETQKNILTYYLKLPDKMQYQQRRQAYRVRIPMSRQLRVFIDTDDDSLTVGELHDLSHGGVGKIIQDGHNKIQRGCQYECVIELPSREMLYCTVEMRYLKKINSRNRKLNRQLIGALFIGLSKMQKLAIARCISDLELEAIRKRAMF